MQDDVAMDNWYRTLTPARRAEIDASDKGRREAVRLANPRFGDGWYPISNAPKDGREIILGYISPDDPVFSFVGSGRWFQGDDDGPDNMGHDAGFMDSSFSFFRCSRTFGATDCQDIGLQPTHWMPLPDKSSL